MGKRGPKPKGKVRIRWSPEFAYAIGLIATDGNLSSDGRHLELTSNDLEQLRNFMKCLGIKVPISYKTSGFSKKLCPRIQFSDVVLYRFLLSIGFMPRKSKVLSKIKIPKKYFFDFLRGHLDGDGTFYSYWDPRWRSSFMFYTVFISASRNHIYWIRRELFKLLATKGHINENKSKSTIELKYAKRESLILLKKIYHPKGAMCLSRKRLKIQRALSMIGIGL